MDASMQTAGRGPEKHSAQDDSGDRVRAGIPYRSGLNWTAASAGVMFDDMSAGRRTAPRVTYVTAALGSRLPLARELCCRSHGAIK